jgi:hypothetical protein
MVEDYKRTLSNGTGEAWSAEHRDHFNFWLLVQQICSISCLLNSLHLQRILTWYSNRAANFRGSTLESAESQVKAVSIGKALMDTITALSEQRAPAANQALWHVIKAKEHSKVEAMWKASVYDCLRAIV